MPFKKEILQNTCLLITKRMNIHCIKLLYKMLYPGTEEERREVAIMC